MEEKEIKFEECMKRLEEIVDSISKETLPLDESLKLYEEGKLIEKTSMQYYDEEAQQFLADRYITGTCPHCKNEHAYGDQCEACGTSLNATDLIDPKSALSGSTPVLKETKHWYLPLDQYDPWLREWILKGHKDDWRPTVYGQCKSWIEQGLQPRAVTRDLSWGVQVPLENAEGKVLYVWFDAPIGYVSNTKELCEKDPEKWGTWQKWWQDWRYCTTKRLICATSYTTGNACPKVPIRK